MAESEEGKDFGPTSETPEQSGKGLDSNVEAGMEEDDVEKVEKVYR